MVCLKDMTQICSMFATNQKERGNWLVLNQWLDDGSRTMPTLRSGILLARTVRSDIERAL